VESAAPWLVMVLVVAWTTGTSRRVPRSWSSARWAARLDAVRPARQPRIAKARPACSGALAQ
jgi:hypothetical protein